MTVLVRSVRFVTLAATSVLIGFFVLITVATFEAQRKSWSRDFLPSLSITSAWQPHRTYTPSIEAALVLLSTVRPEQVAFLRQRGLPILFVPQKTMTEAGCGADDIACTVYATSSIDVPNQPHLPARELAVALSHEIFHAQHHDPLRSRMVKPLWQRVLTGDEETQAHRFSLLTAKRLGIGVSDAAIPYLWLDAIVWGWPIGELILSVCLIVLLSFVLSAVAAI